MPRFKNRSYTQGKVIPIDFKNQIFPGKSDYALHQIGTWPVAFEPEPGSFESPA